MGQHVRSRRLPFPIVSMLVMVGRGKGKDLPASPISTGHGNAICGGPAEVGDLEWDIVGVFGACEAVVKGGW